MRLKLLVAAICFVGVLAGPATSSASDPAAGPPSSMFRPGYDLCDTTSLAALRKIAGLGSLAGGDARATGYFVGAGGVRNCVWHTKRGELLGIGTFLPSLGARLKQMEQMSQFPVLHSPASMPGASKAFLYAFPQSQAGGNRVDLYAVYPKGIVQIAIAGPGKFQGPPTQQLIAVLRLVTHT